MGGRSTRESRAIAIRPHGAESSTMNDTKVQTLLRFLDEAIEGATKLVPRLPVGSVTDVEIATLCMHLRTIELARGVGALIHAGTIAGVPVLYRGLLEVVVDLVNILEQGDEYFEKWMMPNSLDSEIRVVKAARCFDPPLDVVQEGPDSGYVLEQLERQRDNLKERLRAKNEGRIPRKTIKDRFVRAGLLAEYDSIYRAASDFIHSNLFALRQQHVVRCDDGSIRLKLNGVDRRGDGSFFLYRSVEHLMDSTIKTHAHFQTDCEDVLHELRVKWGLMILDLSNPSR